MTQQEFNAAFEYRDAIPYPDDVERIREVARTKLGIEMSPGQAHVLWDWYSETHCAGWLFVDGGEDIAQAIRAFVDRKNFQDDDNDNDT